MDATIFNASIRFSVKLTNRAKPIAKSPQKPVNHFAFRTFRASSCAASGRKCRQRSIVLVVPSALSSPAFDDNAEIIQPATRERLTTLLKAYEDKTTAQIAVLTVPTIGGQSIEE